MSAPKMHTYFPNLDSLRFISATYVFLFHFFAYMQNLYRGQNVLVDLLYKHLFSKGSLGVNFFFVLSGFLITYLLLAEKKERQTISLKKFYVRRILRIWPMFFITVAIGFFLYPLISGRFSASIVLAHIGWYLSFLSNFDIILTGFSGFSNGLLGGLWSVSIEEQFYLLWPLVILILTGRRFIALVILLMIGSFVMRALYIDDKLIMYFHTLVVMNDMLVGSAMAYFVFHYSGVKKKITELPRYLIVFTYGVFFIYLLFQEEFRALSVWLHISERFIFSLFFVFILMEQVYAKNSFIKLGRLNWLDYWGKLSYGFYCLHLLSIMFLQKLNIFLGLDKSPSLTVFFIELVAGLLISMSIAFVTYRYFESPFLKLKDKFRS